MRKTHNLAFQDCESLQAVFDPASCPYKLCAPARVLGEAVLPFPLALAEVTLGVGAGRRVILRSYQEEEAAGEAAGCCPACWGPGRVLTSRPAPQTAPSKPW